MNKIIYLIDAFAQIYRAFYAMPLMSNSKGEYTNAVFGFSRFLLSLEKEYNPEFGAVVFDKGKPLERFALLPDYKANRKPMPDELRSQIEYIRQMIVAFGYPIVEEENREADDVLAGIAVYFKDYSVKIISADKDIAQVIDSRIEMLIPGTPARGLAKRGVKEVLEKFNISPEQIVDYLAMLGDAADNIPGLQGVGVKTAAKLLNQYSSINNMLENPEIIENKKLKDKIIQNEDLLRKNIRLITLNTSLDKKFTDPKYIKKENANWATIKKLAEELELERLALDISNFIPVDSEDSDSNNDLDLFSNLNNNKDKKKKSIPDLKNKLYTPDMF